MDFHLEFIAAINNILDLESGYIQIILTSLSVSIAAIIISFLISIPMASILATKDFYGKSFLIVLVNTSMALPPVVVGLLLYIIFSKCLIYYKNEKCFKT